ncbi:MAG: hypothetical protein IT310_11400 [Anaerolineales bacterium]|nr:hypothetical protein [Anaerolineales bacterium]
MSAYNRSTKEISFAEVAPDVLQAVQAHIEKHNLGDILSAVSQCLLSTSEKIKKGLFSGPGPKLLAVTVILTQRWLILADRADQTAVFVRSMQLQDITVEDYEKSSFQSVLPDTGLNITGTLTDGSEKSLTFLPLGKDAAGERFKATLIQFVQEAKR